MMQLTSNTRIDSRPCFDIGLPMIFDSQAVHVIWGDSAAGCLQQAYALQRDQIVVSSDLPSVGRQILTSDLRKWADARWVAYDDLYGNQTTSEWRKEPGSYLISNTDLLKGNGPIFLWSDGLLATQLLIASVCYVVCEDGQRNSRLHIIRYRYRPPHRGGFASIPTMSIKQLTKHRPATAKLSSNECLLYAQIWRDYCSSEITAHRRLILDSDYNELTDGALVFLKRRYPIRHTGLNEIETNLVRTALEHGPKPARVIGHTMGCDETPDLVGDIYLFRRMLAMSAPIAKHPLFRFEGNTRHMRSCAFNVLPLANEVLSGKQNMIDLNGINQWIGGLHLSENQIMFREDIT